MIFEDKATSALGGTTTYELQALLSGELKRITTFPSGARSEASTLPDGKVRVTSPDGTVSTTTLGPDPRWGLQTALPVSVTVTTPAGKSVTTTTTQRMVTLSDPLNPLTLTTQTDSLTSNGKTVSRAFDKAALTITATSAAGRQRGHYSRWPSRMPLRKWVSTGLPAWLLIVLVAIPLWAMFYLAAFAGTESVARTSGCTVKPDRTFTCFEESGEE